MPYSAKPLRKASTKCALSFADRALRNPIRGLSDCCARATTGNATAPPRAAMNSRRLISHPSDKGRTLAHRQPRIVRRITVHRYDVRVGSLADIAAALSNARFTPESGGGRRQMMPEMGVAPDITGSYRHVR